MGCVSSKILEKSGSFREKVSCSSMSMGHSFQRSSAIEDIILSTSKSNGASGDQFLALLRRTSSSKEPDAAAAAAEPAATARVETIDVSELLAGLEEEESCSTSAAERARERRRQSSRDGSPSPAPCPASHGGGAAGSATGRARSFRTVEELDAMLLTQTQQQQAQSESLQSGSSSGRRPTTTALAAEQEELATATAAAAAASATEAELAAGGPPEPSTGAKRRVRARQQLGELNVPAAAAAAFDFSKSGSLRDWLRQSGQTFSPGSYVTPRFGKAQAPPPAEPGGEQNHNHLRQEEELELFDPELVAHFERAMERLSEDEGRVLDEILEALELDAAQKDGGAAVVVGKVGGDQAAAAVLV